MVPHLENLLANPVSEPLLVSSIITGYPVLLHFKVCPHNELWLVKIMLSKNYSFTNYTFNIYIGINRSWYRLDWFGWVLWHINHCRLFNAKFCLYICIIYDMVWLGFMAYEPL